MKVSIITVCYNSGKTIEDTIQSVLGQVYENIEYIIVDGGSKDNTNSIIEKYRSSIDVYISEPDEGLYDAMNKGISLASGDVIGILNSDDVFLSESSVLDLMNGFDTGVDGVYSDLVYVKENDVSSPTRFYSSKIFKKERIKYGLMLAHPTFYVKKELYEKYGLYKCNYRVAADFELITRFASHDINLKYIPTVSVKMREGGVSSSGLIWRIHQNFEIIRACKENNIYTNIFLVSLKLPYKFLSILKRKSLKI